MQPRLNGTTQPQYDLFLSHAEGDRTWVEATLLPQLEAAGLRVCLAWRDFAIGLPTLVNIERAIDHSRHTLIVLTPDWLASQWNEFEGLLTSSSDPAGRRRRVIPLLLKPCPLPPRLSLLTCADFSEPTQQASQMARLLRGVGRRAQIFISYKRNVEPDEPLMQRLRGVLEAAGHGVFVDQKLVVGVEWAKIST